MRWVRHGDGTVGVENQAEQVGARAFGADDEYGVQEVLLVSLDNCREDFMAAAGVLSRNLPSPAARLSAAGVS